LIYTTGFFITSNFEALMMAAEFACANNKPFGFNLSAPFLIQFELEKIKAVLPYADYVFCNEDEQAAMQIALDSSNVAETIANIEKKNTKRPKRVVIMTQGPLPTQVCVGDHSEGCVTTHENVEVPALDKDLIVDTNGAGDSFVGGFFAGVLTGQDVRKCVEMGNELARTVVQNSGCQFN
jgi:adenosine kinase